VVMAIKTLLEPGSHFATTEMEVKFLHPVKKGVLTAKARVVSREDRIIKGRATIYDEDERAVMEFASTFKIARDSRLHGITFADLTPSEPGGARGSSA
jgi:acyl-CoA thioesterase